MSFKSKFLIVSLFLTTWTTLSGAVAAQRRDPFAAARAAMVERYVVAEGIKNRRVLQAMRTVPRHEFVKSAFRKQSYFDTALAIGHKQTISPPFIVAYMTESIDPRPSDRVLEIGTGSGYQAAVLSVLAKQVYTIEIVKPLGESSKRLLKKLGYGNVHVKVGDGYKGWPDAAPFDKIIVTCSPERVPQPLVNQLREGGKMIVPLGQRYQQVFHLFEKQQGKLVETKLIPTLFVPMTGASEENRRVQPDPANPVIVNGGFERDANDDGRVDNWHYQRQVTMTADEAPEGDRFLRFENEEPGRASQLLQGMPVDGRKIAALNFRLHVRVHNIRRGFKDFETPALIIHFYDSVRRPLGEGVIGPWTRSSDWHEELRPIKVPPKAREAVVRIGLNGATGILDVDRIRMTIRHR